LEGLDTTVHSNSTTQILVDRAPAASTLAGITVPECHDAANHDQPHVKLDTLLIALLLHAVDDKARRHAATVIVRGHEKGYLKDVAVSWLENMAIP